MAWCAAGVIAIAIMAVNGRMAALFLGRPRPARECVQTRIGAGSCLYPRSLLDGNSPAPIVVDSLGAQDPAPLRRARLLPRGRATPAPAGLYCGASDARSAR